MCNALIIGAGSIGALKDDKFDNPNNPDKVLTHAHAFYKHSDIKIKCIIDPDLQKARKAAEKWGAEYAIATRESGIILDNMPIDIVSICSPTETHRDIVQLICEAEHKPKVLIIEKPCGSNLNECIDIENMCSAHSIPVIVPYIRRFIPELIDLKKFIDTCGVIYGANIYYNRGLYRDGCHAIDFSRFLFGKFIQGCSLSGAGIPDYSKDDLTCSYRLTFEYCDNVIMHAVDGRVGSIFEMDIITDKGRFTLVDNFAKVREYGIEREPVYGNYNRYNPEYGICNTQLHRGLDFMAQNAIDVINGFEPKCGIDDALAVHEIIEEIK